MLTVTPKFPKNSVFRVSKKGLKSSSFALAFVSYEYTNAMRSDEDSLRRRISDNVNDNKLLTPKLFDSSTLSLLDSSSLRLESQSIVFLEPSSTGYKWQWS